MRLRWAVVLLIATASPFRAWTLEKGNMEGMSDENFLANGRFEQTAEAVYPWLGVDGYGWLRKSVALDGVYMHVDKSNQFAYAQMGQSASFVDLDADGLPDIVSPDGGGIFWFWKNVGTPGDPRFGTGEVMPLLVDNERSTFRKIEQDTEQAKERKLSRSEERAKEKVDAQRQKAFERLQRENNSLPKARQRSEDELRREAEAGLPYPWQESSANAKPGETTAYLNGYRQLRAVAAPCDWDGNGTPDFVVGDAQGNIYLAGNGGKPGAPQFRTYTKSADRIVLKLVKNYSIVTRKTTLEPVSFMNYTAPCVVDWNRDGVRDLLVGEGTYSVNAIRLYLFSGRAQSQPTERLLMVGGERTFLAPTVGDWDGDGHLDLFVCDDKGLLTVHPNLGGAYSAGDRLMGELQTITFEGRNDSSFLAYCTPQACDWNADGILDITWSSPYGRIMYALGKAKGATSFGPPTPVRSTAPERVTKLAVPVEMGFCAVPTIRGVGGGTADASRYSSQQGGSKENESGFPKPLNVSQGLMPSWDSEVREDRSLEDRKRYAVPGYSASWAVAPVPYEVFQVAESSAGDPGLGRTFQLTWHDPSRNLLFKQPRDQINAFGHGVSLSVYGAQGRNKSKALVDTNIRVAFYIKTEGRFSRMSVTYESGYYIVENGKPDWRGPSIIDFKTVSPMPSGSWIRYEAVVPKGKFPRSTGGDLYIRLYGRGSVSLRDVALSSTNLAPSTP